MIPKSNAASPGGYTPSHNVPLILTYETLAELLGVSKRSLEELVSKRAIPHRKVGARVIFYWPAIEEWLRGGGGTKR